MKIQVSLDGNSCRLLKLPLFSGKGGPPSLESKFQECSLFPNIEAVRLLGMSVNIYQSTESDISEDLDLPQYRRKDVKPQINLPHSLLQKVCELCSETRSKVQIGDMQDSV